MIRKIFALSFILSIAFYTQAFAFSWGMVACNDTNGVACYNCGSGCTATLYQDGKLVLSGTEVPDRGDSTHNDTFVNSAIKPTSLILEEGITKVGRNALWGISDITSVEIPDSLTQIGSDGLALNGKISKLTIGENSISIGKAYGNPGIRDIPLADNVEVFCKGDIEKCKANKSGLFDNQGIGLTFVNQTGMPLAKYDGNGNLSAQYAYGADGSVYTYDANGNLNSMSKKGAFTPAEAMAVVKKGNNNTVSITW